MSNSQSQNRLPPSVRLRVNIVGQRLPVVFSYKELLKQHLRNQNSETAQHNQNPDIGLDEHDDFFRGLLERSMHYDPRDDEEDDGEDVDSEEEYLREKRRSGEDEYDSSDSFIDDSDLIVSEPQASNIPHYGGYFVYHGPLDGFDPVLEEVKAKDAQRESTAVTIKEDPQKSNNGLVKSHKQAEVIEISDSEDTRIGNSVQMTPSVDHGLKPAVKVPTTTKRTSVALNLNIYRPFLRTTVSKKKAPLKPEDLRPLDPDVEKLVAKIREDVKDESFENKGKFPQRLRPATLEAGLLMYRKINNVDENLVNHLMAVLPYNRFTLTKFLATRSGRDRVSELRQEIKKMMDTLKQKVDMAMRERLLYQNQTENVYDPQQAGASANKFLWNDELRKLLYDILEKDRIATAIQNDIEDLSDKPENIITEIKARKSIYQELLNCWPKDCMSTYELSRQYTQCKAKLRSGNDADKTSNGAEGVSNAEDLVAESKDNPDPTDSIGTLAAVKRPAPRTSSQRKRTKDPTTVSDAHRMEPRPTLQYSVAPNPHLSRGTPYHRHLSSARRTPKSVERKLYWL